MAATPIVRNQVKRIATFLYILAFLLIVNLVFTLRFKWDGFPIIVNVYLYVFSFYLVFNFSLIDIPPLKEEYRNLYGGFGVAWLFFKTRILPFLFIYFITVVYTFINFINDENWPWSTVLELLDGRFSNTVFYSLILLIILKFNRRPKITLLLFVAGAAIYFGIYQFVFLFSPSGAAMSGLKFFQISIGLALMVYEFAADRPGFDWKKVRKAVVGGLFMGLCLYSFFIGTLAAIYLYSPFASYQQGRAGQILMRLGYSFPLKNYKAIVLETSNPLYLYDLIYYSRAYGRPLALTGAEWENLILANNMAVANIIAYYTESMDVEMSYDQIMAYAQKNSVDAGEILVRSSFFTKYASRFCREKLNDMIDRYRKGNRAFKTWIIRVMAHSSCAEAVPFLLDRITDIDYELAKEAYGSLSSLSGMDPAKKEGVPINSYQVILRFSEWYRRSRTTR